MAQVADGAGRKSYTVTIRGIVHKSILLTLADANALYGSNAVEDP